MEFHGGEALEPSEGNRFPGTLWLPLSQGCMLVKGAFHCGGLSMLFAKCNAIEGLTRAWLVRKRHG